MFSETAIPRLALRIACALAACVLFAAVCAMQAPLAFAEASSSTSQATQSEGSEETGTLATSSLEQIGTSVEDIRIDRAEAYALSRANEEGSSTEYFIAVDIPQNRTIILKRDGDAWKIEHDWICSTGAPDMPTVIGSFEVGDKGYAFGSEYTCYYYTQFFGNYLFHSVKYEPGTFDIQDGRLGEAISEGCVRLEIENAQWIYDNIPWGTRVVTYA